MDHLSSLNPKQREAACILDGPVLVIAGAGSGKTRVVTSRVVHLIKSGIAPSQILGLTFTNKAAKEMKTRVNELTSAHVFISTFHSLGARILRESIAVLGFSQDFIIYDEDDSLKILSQCLEEIGIREKKGELRAWKGLVSKTKNDLVDFNNADLSWIPDTHRAVFPKLYQSYQSKLKACNAVDFDDLLLLPVELLRGYPEVRKKYQTRWTHLLIDEYQDTNEAQYAFVKWLVEASKNIFVVGDPDQAIYSWRGANVSNILDFETDYEGSQVILLEQNYRSSTTILRAANALISANSDRYGKKLWSTLGEGDQIGRFCSMDDRGEAQFVAQKIRKHRDIEQIPFKEMVIFYRTNAQSRPFEDQLLSLRIPYTIVGGLSFYQRKEIKDILSYLRLVLSDQDEVAFTRVINIPSRGIGKTTEDRLVRGASAENAPILRYCRSLIQQKESFLTTKGKQSLRDFLALIDKLRAVAKEGSMQTLVKSLIEESGYLEFLKDDKETFRDRKENLDELITKAVEWDLSHEIPHLPSFLEELSLKSSLDESASDTDRVNLMTLHHGKGLEFKVAFLVGLEEGLLPHVNAQEDNAAIEEERRLCYVGMTRAKEYLYLTDSQTRYLWGSSRFQRPSRFLKEIPAEFVKRVYS